MEQPTYITHFNPDTILARLPGILEHLQRTPNLLLCRAVTHYAASAGDRGWGCGYRCVENCENCLDPCNFDEHFVWVLAILVKMLFRSLQY